MKLVRRIAISVTVSAVVLLAVAVGLALFGTPGPREGKVESFSDFGAMRGLDYSGLPDVRTFAARDGRRLGYRFYPADTRRVLILIHGSGYHGRYLHPLASAIAAANAARVYVPDQRGHGSSAPPRGDIDYIDQLTDDLDDLIALIKRDAPGAEIVIGGHSSGGGLAVRFMGTPGGKDIAGYLLLAPFLGHDAPTTRPDSGGWARPYLPRIIGLTILNKIGITALNGLTAIDFAMPPDARDGTETLSYSYRLLTGFAPRDYQTDVTAIGDTPVLVLVGDKDEAFYPDRYAAALPKATVKVLPGLTHLGLAIAPETAARAIFWLKGL